MTHIDKEFIRKLSKLAPIVPVIAKADTMTLPERAHHIINVRNVLNELRDELGKDVIYQFNEVNPHFISNDIITYEQYVQSLEGNGADEKIPDTPAPKASTDVAVQTSGKNSDICKETFSEQETTTSFRSENSSEWDFKKDDNPSSKVTEKPSLDDIPNPERSMKKFDFITENGTYQAYLPMAENIFAVVGDSSEANCRVYPHGKLDIYDENHSDFRRLQRLLFESGTIGRMKMLTQAMTMEYDAETKSRVLAYDVEYIRQRVGRMASDMNGAMSILGWLVPLIVLLWVFDGDTALRLLDSMKGYILSVF